MKISKKAQLEDWIQAFVVAILLILIYSILLVKHYTAEGNMDKETSLIKEKIEKDAALMEYLNKPLGNCNWNKNTVALNTRFTDAIYTNVNFEKTTYSDLISVFMSGDSKIAYTTYYIIKPDLIKSYIEAFLTDLKANYEKPGDYDVYSYLWATCTQRSGTQGYDYINYDPIKQGLMDRTNDVIQIIYEDKDGNHGYILSEEPLGRPNENNIYLYLPTKSKKFPVINIYLRYSK